MYQKIANNLSKSKTIWRNIDLLFNAMQLLGKMVFFVHVLILSIFCLKGWELVKSKHALFDLNATTNQKSLNDFDLRIFVKSINS